MDIRSKSNSVENVEVNYLAQALHQRYSPRQKNLFPTSFSNQIKLIAEIIFNKYTDGNSMNQQQFKQWIVLHQNFLKTFDYCFRTELW